MKCKRCGSTVDGHFCRVCGTKVKKELSYSIPFTLSLFVLFIALLTESIGSILFALTITLVSFFLWRKERKQMILFKQKLNEKRMIGESKKEQEEPKKDLEDNSEKISACVKMSYSEESINEYDDSDNLDDLEFEDSDNSDDSEYVPPNYFLFLDENAIKSLNNDAFLAYSETFLERARKARSEDYTEELLDKTRKTVAILNKETDRRINKRKNRAL